MSEPQNAIKGLIDALQDKDIFIGEAAAKTLGQLGPVANAALPALKAYYAAASRDITPGRRTTAKEAINKIAPGEVPQDPPPAPTVQNRNAPLWAPPKPVPVTPPQDVQNAIGRMLGPPPENGKTRRKGRTPPNFSASATEPRTSRTFDPKPSSNDPGVKWRDKAGASTFRIEDQGESLELEFLDGDRSLRRLSGTLTRSNGSKAFKGTLEAVFADDSSKEYQIRTSAKFVRNDELDLNFENWPRNSVGRKAAPRTVHRTLRRQSAGWQTMPTFPTMKP